jgi:hypothetical protein
MSVPAETEMRALLALCGLVVCCACATQQQPRPEHSIDAPSGAPPLAGAGAPSSPEVRQMRITIGSAVFFATLSDNATSRAFAAKLPLTLDMRDVNANEKYHELPGSLPANASNPGTIQAGDIMLYGSNGLVLFYETFSTSYNYTRIAKLHDASGLAAAVGSGEVTVTFAP